MLKKLFFIYFDGSGSGSGYPRIIEYRDGYPKPGYPETTNPDPDIKSTDPTDPDPDPDTLNFPDIRIRPRATRGYDDVYKVRMNACDSINSMFCLYMGEALHNCR